MGWLNLDGLERIKLKEVVVGDKVLHRIGHTVTEIQVTDPAALGSTGTYYLLDRLVAASDALKGVVPGVIGYATFRDGTEHAGLVELDGRFVYVEGSAMHYVYTDAITDFVAAGKPAADAKGKK
jgi:hypothetical protein